jgi:hypothetical protein
MISDKQKLGKTITGMNECRTQENYNTINLTIESNNGDFAIIYLCMQKCSNNNLFKLNNLSND